MQTMNHQPIIDCPKCGTRVIPTTEGNCPACGVQLPTELASVVSSLRAEECANADKRLPNPTTVETHKTTEPASSKQPLIDISVDGNLRWVGSTIICLCIAIPICFAIELVFPGAFRGAGRINRAINQSAKLKQAEDERAAAAAERRRSLDRAADQATLRGLKPPDIDFAKEDKLEQEKLKSELSSQEQPSAEKRQPKQSDKSP
jgi:hypothetical protein